MLLRNILALISLAVVCVCLLSTIISMSTEMKVNINNNADTINKLIVNNDLYQERLNEVEKSSSIINVKLVQIQTSLAEIKIDIKNIDK